MKILAISILAVSLTACSTPRGSQSPDLPPINLPPAPEVPVRLPVEAMRGCDTLPPVPPISSMNPEAQARSVAEYILTLYGAYSDCSERHNELGNWINDNIK